MDQHEHEQQAQQGTAVDPNLVIDSLQRKLARANYENSLLEAQVATLQQERNGLAQALMVAQAEKDPDNAKSTGDLVGEPDEEESPEPQEPKAKAKGKK